MGAINWGDAGTWAGVITSVGLSATALWVSIRSARRADAAAERSAASSERSAAAAERQIELAEAAANQYLPPWRIEPTDDISRYLLVNDGPDTAHNVTIEADFLVEKAEFKRIGPRGVQQFFAAYTGGHEDDVVTVRWWRHPSHGGDAHEWQSPLP